MKLFSLIPNNISFTPSNISRVIINEEFHKVTQIKTSNHTHDM